MSFVRFSTDDGQALGMLEDGEIVELDVNPDDDVEALRRSIESGADLATGRTFAEDNVRLEAPIEQPGKVICIGLNYSDHAEEGGNEIPDEPMLFSKATSAVVGPQDPVVYPRDVSKLDYEAELAIVIGKEGRRIPEADAVDHVLGYTAFNDVSARDVQYAFSQFFRGKSFDTFGPLGPGIVKPDSVDVSDLSIRSFVNDDRRQDSSTAQMIFSVPEIIASVSQTMTLRPGDIIATGTPPGVGVHREPPELLEVGDTVTVEIEGIGALENPITAEEQ